MKRLWNLLKAGWMMRGCVIRHHDRAWFSGIDLIRKCGCWKCGREHYVN
jgi:hypothetical protein